MGSAIMMNCEKSTKSTLSVFNKELIDWLIDGDVVKHNMSIHLSLHLSICLSVCHIYECHQNTLALCDFSWSGWSWIHTICDNSESTLGQYNMMFGDVLREYWERVY